MPTATRKTRTDKFGKGSRFYSVENKDFPSVTTVLQVLPKPFLIAWAAKLERQSVIEAATALYEECELVAGKAHIYTKLPGSWFASTLETRLGKKKAHKVVMETAGDIGTRIHWMAEMYNRSATNSGFVSLPAGEIPLSVDDKAEDHAFRAYVRWAESVSFKPSHAEHVVYSKEHRYAGCLDVRGLVNGVDCLVDLKTGKSIYDDYFPQVAAYAHAAAEMGEGFPSRTLIVRIPKDLSEPECEVVEVTDLLKHFRTFLAALALWRCLNVKGEE